MGMDGMYFYAILIVIILIPIGFAAYCYCYNRRIDGNKDDVSKNVRHQKSDHNEPQFENIYPGEKEFKASMVEV